MRGLSMFVVLMFLALASALNTEDEKEKPPHCTIASKVSDYPGFYRFDYPTRFFKDKEYHQPLYCIEPSTVGVLSTEVCDWAAPPLVNFEYLDRSVNVERQDPSGRFDGEASITTFQRCSHFFNQSINDYSPTVTKMH